MRTQFFRMKQLTGHDCFFLIFVGIEGRDALLGRPVLFVREARLLQRVQIPMPRHQQGCPVADLQIVRRDCHAFRRDILYLLPKIIGIDCYAVSEDIDDAFPEDTGRKQMQRKLSFLIDHGMPRVSPALIADHDVVLFCQKIDHPAFAFIAPVDTYYCTSFHIA